MQNPSLRRARSRLIASVPPGPPTAGDRELLAGVQSIELAASDLYQAVLAAGEGSQDGGDAETVYRALRDDHRAAADVLSGLIGRSASGQPDAGLFDEQSNTFSTARGEELATAAYDLESTLVATYTGLLAQLEGVDGASTIASIVVTEARHCAVLANLTGNGDDLDDVLTNTADALPLTAP